MVAEACHSFWRFTLGIYAEDDVRTECLVLQDEWGLDVNLVLLCFWWVGVTGRAFGLAELGLARRAAADWNAAVVWPLRHLRRLEATRGREGEFYQVLLARELDGERAAQALMVEALAPVFSAYFLPSHRVLGIRRILVMESLRRYAALAGQPRSALYRMFRKLVQAGF